MLNISTFLKDVMLCMLVRLMYIPIFTLLYRNNIWSIYKSYQDKPKNWKKIIWNKYMEKHAASISIDAKIASPLILPHGVSGIFITQSATIGQNVVIFQQVTIGANTIKGSKSYGAPNICDNVYIGAGAKIIGNANIHVNSRIGANAVVTTDIPANSTVVCGKSRIIMHSEVLNNTFIPFLQQ